VIVVRSRARDEGSATIWVLTLCVVVWSAAVAAASVGAALVARHRAESAADLAALAAAQAAVRGDADSCGRAARVAAATGVRLVGCRLGADGSVLVITEVRAPGLVAQWTGMPPARARARAGGLMSVDDAARSVARPSEGGGR
jgi:secretion/DNA translocation related TadE-like protein